MMDEWEKFNETTWAEKEYITDADYIQAKRVCKNFEIKKSGEYHDLYLKSDTSDIDMLLIVEKRIREEYVMQFIDLLKLIPNIWKIMIKIKNHHILNIGM